MGFTRFTFRLEKLIYSLAYFSHAGVCDLTKLKAAKLLYFADKEHLLKHGRPILGDVYFCMKYGPVPSVALNEMNDAITAPEVDSDAGRLGEVLKVHKPFLGGNPTFQIRGTFDDSVFSLSELDALKRTVEVYGSHTAGQLVKLSHQDLAWTIPNEQRDPEGRVLMPYELFLAEASPEAKEVFELTRAEQEESREFDHILGD